MAFGVSSFKFDRKTGKMKRSRFLTIYSAAVSTVLLMLTPLGFVKAFFSSSKNANTFGLVIMLGTSTVIVISRYFVQLTIFWCIIFKRDELFQLVNAMIRLSGILRRNVRGLKIDKRMVFLLLLKIIANVMELTAYTVAFILDYRNGKLELSALLFEVNLVAIFHPQNGGMSEVLRIFPRKFLDRSLESSAKSLHSSQSGWLEARGNF